MPVTDASTVAPGGTGVPWQPSPFHPPTIYDAPRQAISSLLEGEATLRGSVAALLSPNEATPRERQTFADSLKAAVGGSRLGNALIDIVTNPWVWAMAITSPMGSRSVVELFRSGAKYSEFVLKRAPFLGAIGALSPTQILGTTATAVVHRFEEGYRKVLSGPAFQRMNELQEQVVRNHGLDIRKGLNWQLYTDGSEQQRIARELSSILDASMDGTLTGRAPVAPAYQNGRWTLLPTRSLKHPFSEELIERALRERGLAELRDAYKAVYKEIAEQVFSSPESILRLFRSSTSQRFSAMSPDATSGIKVMMGRELFKVVQKADLSDPEQRRVIEQMFIRPVFDPANKYVPRNAVDTFVGGRPVEPNIGYGPFVRPAGSTIPRHKGFVPYHPEDLAVLATAIGERNPHVYAYIEKLSHKMATSTEEMRFQRLNADRKLDRYTNQMARSYAMFVQDIGDTVRRSNYLDVTKNPITLTVGREGYGTAASHGLYNEPILMLERFGKVPAGGITLADVLGMLHSTQPATLNRRLIEHVLVPHLMGFHRPEYTAMKAGLAWSKEMINAFLSGPVGRAIRKYGGTWGRRFVDQGRTWALADDGLAGTTLEVSKATQLSTMLLYSSHLGFNFMSAIVNATQPILFTGNWVGMNHLLRGYGRAFARLGNYLTDRVRQYGIRPILSDTERNALIQKHFGDLTEFRAGNTTMDFLDIGQSGLELIEGAGMARWAKKTNFLDNAFLVTMKAFEKAEWLNRIVSAEAGLSAARSAGLGTIDTALMVNRLVRETQYGGHWMNQPAAFMSGASKAISPASPLLLGQNPLMRMFLSFPLRSFTAWVHTSPLLRGGEGALSRSGAWELLQTTVRGMGVSALMHEAGKNILHADLSRAGFASAVTDIIPGMAEGRYDAREGVIPLPPAVDIPFQMFRGILDGDIEVWRHALPRLIPGGVALARALGAVAPELPAGLDVVLGQRTYADYTAMTPDGMVPIYRADGSLLTYQRPLDMILRATGTDMDRWRESGKLDEYFLKQRNQIVRYEQEFLRKALANDIDGALAVAREYQRRHGVPLLVSRDQIRNMIHSRTVTRTERLLDTMPTDVRDAYRNMLAISRVGLSLGIDPDLVSSANTSRTRIPVQQRPSGFPTMTPESLELLIRHLKDHRADGQEPSETAGFMQRTNDMHQPYSPFAGYR